MKRNTAVTVAQGRVVPLDKPTSIFVAAKQDFSVEGLMRMLSDSTDNKVVACVEPSEACWDKLRNLHPEILLLHYQAVMSPKLEFFARIKSTAPGVSVIIFGQHMDDDFLFDILRAGASGYLNENMNGHDLLEAIREVKQGRLWVERRVLEILALESIDRERALENSILERIETVRKILTKRETEIFKFLLDGFATKEIAKHIHLSEQSVKLHLGRIFAKFQVNNRSQLILATFARICPVTNVYRLIRMTLDKRRIEKGQSPLIEDPLGRDPASLNS